MLFDEDISFVQICEEQDSNLFLQILQNKTHVIHQLLPPLRNVPYSLRPRAHDREVSVANATMRKNFIYRMLYLDSYQFLDCFSYYWKFYEQSSPEIKPIR